ncbi:MAG: hypothetical protein PHO83_17315 [Geobacteraceae bacterium]|nr:hypothetical protein [Geobacteraceae bacterium]
MEYYALRIKEQKQSTAPLLVQEGLGVVEAALRQSAPKPADSTDQLP